MKGKMAFGAGVLSLWLLAVLLPADSCAQSKSMDLLRVGLYQEPTSFDPHTSTMTDTDDHLRNVYEPLVGIADADPTDFKPILAETWSVSEDGLTYTFNLRKGVKFTDGTEFNASAAKFNFDRILSLKRGGSYSVLMDIDHVSVKGDYRIEIRFKRPGPILAFLGYSNMVSPSSVKKNATKDDPWAQRWLVNHTAGTAPYKLEEWVKGVRYRLVENPLYWGRWGSHFKAVDCRVIYEMDVQRLMLERGDLDVALSLPFDALPSLRKNPEIRIYENVSPSSIFLLFNHMVEPTKNPWVRKALAHAWNYEAYSIVRRGLAPRSDGPVPSIMLGKGYTPPPRYEYDLKLARDYLVKAGYPNGFTINFLSQKGDEEKKMMFDVYQNELAKIGVKSNYLEKTFAGIVETTKDRNLMSDPKNAMHLVSLYVSSAPFTPWKMIFRVYGTEAQMDRPYGGALNMGYYSNPKVDDFISKALSRSRQGAVEFWRKANEELIHDYASIPTVNRVIIYGMRRDIKGFTFRPHYLPGTTGFIPELSR